MIRLIVSEVCKSYQLHVNFVGRGATRVGFFSSLCYKENVCTKRKTKANENIFVVFA
ncbi:hypothetical protein HanXRQr2_Chr16g0741161 [Helianthus annuus]|uniref:Uncharacterized protein n=1 Tax=Helianthus annuus TaxID=4232 RepID=A0A9K3GXB1_HELAN|nr:hypothetical protein HanXRQr2_Chr16g0741161 [Helianthus annuus]